MTGRIGGVNSLPLNEIIPIEDWTDERKRIVATAILGGSTVQKAIEAANVTRGAYYYWCGNDPQFKATLYRGIPIELQSAMPNAIKKLEYIMENGEPDEQRKAAEALLREGKIMASRVQVPRNINVTNNTIISNLTDDELLSRLRKFDPAILSSIMNQGRDIVKSVEVIVENADAKGEKESATSGDNGTSDGTEKP